MRSPMRWVVLGLGLLGMGCNGSGEAIPKEGDLAPEFTLTADDGQSVTLADFRGRSVVVLYFYPKDQTPGCTKQACGFRDAMADYEARGIKVFGVSVDSVASHQAFKARENLNFTLLADPDKEVTRRYGVLNPLGLASRVTFVVGTDGRIRKILRDFDPATNARQVLDVLPREEGSGR